MKVTLFFTVGIFLISPCVRADDLTSAIAPYVNEKTIVVARLDADHIEVNAAQQWWESATKGAAPDAAPLLQSARQGLQTAGNWLDAFRKAGGHSLFVVVFLGDSPGGQMFLMAPIQSGANAQGLIQSFAPLAPPGMKTVQIQQAVFMTDDATLAELQKFKPSPRPELEQAFADAGNAPIRAAVVVSEDLRRIVEALAGKMPPEIGGGPVTVLTDGVRWASLSLKLPPEPAMTLRVQSKDADAAQAFAGLIRLGMLAARQHQNANDAQIGVMLNQLLTPKVENDRISISVESAQMSQLAQSATGPILAARSRASLEVSMSNMKQLLLACIIYANAHKDAFPDSLEQATKEAEIPAGSLINPHQPNRQPGYVYLKPGSAKDIKNPSQHVVIYEAHDPDAKGIGVGYADGHVQVLPDDAAVQRAIADSGTTPAK